MAIGTPVSLGTNNTSASGSFSTTLTTTAAVTAGESIVVAINYPAVTAVLSSVTDSAGNTYSIDVSQRHPTDTARYIAMASCHNATALPLGGTITATSSISISAIRTITAASISGLAASSTKDGSSGNTGNSTTWSTGATATLAQADEIGVAFAMSLASTANTPDAGWNEIIDFAPQVGRRCVLQYQIVSSTTALNAGGTWGSGIWIGVIATYKASATQPATVTADTAAATAAGDTVTLPGVTTQVTADTAAATASGDTVNALSVVGTGERFVSDGIWTWYNDPRAITYNGALYVGHIRTNGDVAVVKVVLATGVYTSFTLAAAFEDDDHDNPALCFLPDGRLAAFYSQHNDSTGVRMRVTTSAEDLSAWGSEIVLPMPGSSVSYANPWVLSAEANRLYLMFRDGTARPQIIYSDDWDVGAPTWSTPRTVFGAVNRPYVKYVGDGVDKLHFFASLGHPREITAGQCHMYHWYYDAGDGNFHTSDGTTIRSLASLATTGALTTAEVTKVYDATTDSGGGNGNAWPWSIELDGIGRPVVAYSVYEALGDNDYHYARWTGSAWQRHTILTGQGSLYASSGTEDQYVGGMSIVPDDTTQIYLSTDDTGQWEIQRWTTSDGGATWAIANVTYGSTVKNLRPYCPRGTGGPDVLWARGTYTTFTAYDTEVWTYPPILRRTYRQSVDDDAPLVVLRLDETSGTTAEDTAGANDGTYVNSPTLAVAGPIAEGTAVTLNGTTQHITLPDLSLGETSAVTYEAWFKTAVAGDEYIVAEASTTDNDPILALLVDAGGNVRSFIRDDGGGGQVAESADDYNDGEWHHAALILDGASLMVLVDGVVRDEITVTEGARTLNTTAIGALVRASVGSRFTGSIDEVALYDTALSPGQVQGHYENRDVVPVEDLLPSAIASAETVGTPTIIADSAVAPSAIASGEALGSPTVLAERFVDPSAIGSAQTFGALVVQSPRKVVPVGIASPEATGTPSVGAPAVRKTLRVRLNPGHQGIPTREAFGTPKLTPGVLKPSSIASAQAVGTPNIVIPQFVSPTAIPPSAEAVGTPSLARPDTIIPNSIAAGQVGTPQISRAGAIEPVSIASAEAAGSPTLTTLSQAVSPAGIGSAEVVHAPTVLRGAAHVVTPTGVPLPTVFGNPIVTLGGNAPITPSSIITRESFGLPRITLGQPAGPPPGYVPGRIANRLYDTETGVAFAFAINHSEEDPRSFERQYEAGAPTALGLVRQQSAAEPWRLTLRGTLLDPSQKTSLDTLYDHCDQNTLTYEDYSGESYEVIVTSWDCRPERVALNPFTSGLHVWRYTLELTILRVLHGAVYSTIGVAPATPADITIVQPTIAKRPTGIPSLAGVGIPVFTGGSIVLVPSAIRPADWSSNPILVGAGGSGGPAPFPSRLRAQGTRIVDATGVQVSRMTGVNVHCLPDYIPSQADLHDIASRGGAWVRVVLLWSRLESTQGVFASTMRTQIDTLLARCEAAGLYAMLELHLNVGSVPSWGGAGDETAMYADHGEFITKALAQRYANNKVVLGFGLNEIPAYQATITYGNGAIPYLESVQRTMIEWFRVSAPDWIGFVTLGYSNQTPYPDSPRTAASASAYNAVGGNVVLDVHHYLAGVNSSDPSYDGRQPNGMIYPTYQGGLAIWQAQEHPISYSDTAVHRAQIAAFLADYVTFCNAAQIPLMVGEVGWAANNTGGKAAWWAAVIAALDGANPAMVAQWIFAYGVPPQEYWAAKPNGTWEPAALTLLGSGV